MIIRPETAGDAEAIRQITEAAFAGQPYSDQTEARIIDRLRSEDAMTLSLVAEEEGEVIGHIAFSPVTITPFAVGWYGLGPRVGAAGLARTRHGERTCAPRARHAAQGGGFRLRPGGQSGLL